MIQYNLMPEEFVRIVDVLAEYFDEDSDERTIEGFSEEEIVRAEQRLKTRIPAAYRRYLLECGKARLNQELHRLYPPEEIVYSYDLIRLWGEEDDWGEDSLFTRILNLPEEQWEMITENYLVLWVENQGCFHAGIRVKDLGQDSPPVYITVDDSLFEWEKVSDSCESFILSMLVEAVRSEAEETVMGKAELEAYFAENGIEQEKLLPEKMPFENRSLRTFWDPEKQVIGIYYLLPDQDGNQSLDWINLSDDWEK